MALKLDEDYNGTTLLSAWWEKVKGNFGLIKTAVEDLQENKADKTAVEELQENKADKVEFSRMIADEADNRSGADVILATEIGNEAEARAKGDESILRTLDAEIGARESADVEILDKIGNLDDLPTVDKSSIVNAIIALKKLIGSSGTTETDVALKVMTDYNLEYAKEGVYAKDPIDNMPLGLYIFSPTQDIEHIFLVSADGESELAVLSEPLYQNNVYILRFGSDSSEIIAGFGSSGIDMSEIDETLSAINKDIKELRRKRATHFGICTDSRNTLAKTVTVSDSELILTDGLQITIRFNNGLRSTTIAEGITTLNINNTGSKDLLIGGIDNTTAEDSTGKIYVDNNGVITVVYDKAMDAYAIVGRESFNASGTGAPGKSAYEIAVAEGFKGSIAEWLESLKGEQGPTVATISVVGSVEDMTDTAKKYILADTGTIWAYYGKNTYGNSYTNLADPTSDDWVENARLNSSGGTTAITTITGINTTNYIPVSINDTIRVQGMDLTEYNMSAYKNNRGHLFAQKVGTTEAYYNNAIATATGGQLTITSTDVAYVRFSGVLNGAAEDVIITVNEEICSPTLFYKEGWYDTGIIYNGSDVETLSAIEERTSLNESNITKNTENIDIIKKKIESIIGGSNTSESSTVYPSVWDDAVEECISKIKAMQHEGGRNCVTFPFFSDNHQRNGHAGALIAKVMNECNIPYCFYGGDSISSGYIDSEATMIAQDKAFDIMMQAVPNGRFCRAVGNHDGYWNVSAESGDENHYTRAQVYNLFLREESIAQNKHFGDDGTYYYVEDIASKVRFVVMNTNGGSVDAVQLNWLKNTALKFTESGWVVVFISHQPITNNYHANISNAQAVQSILTEYINGTDANKADVAGWFSGHIHRDRIYQCDHTGNTEADDTTTVSLPWKTVTITSDHTGIAYDNATLHTVANDDQSHAIDFVTINKSTRTVNITRLGIGEDRSYIF